MLFSNEILKTTFWLASLFVNQGLTDASCLSIANTLVCIVLEHPSVAFLFKVRINREEVKFLK